MLAPAGSAPKSIATCPIGTRPQRGCCDVADLRKLGDIADVEAKDAPWDTPMADYVPWILVAGGIVALIVAALIWRAHYVSSD
ncbi:hypothetical protein CI1B_02500 [Bradyrhizobium ivorense]|uniref:Uncharacterized protein n=1 Tax=Bradyrhizobium ivorense TaxID=2511166 RepID=A0A508SS42_9BRAD|nr:hypothetical protein CI1B_02500 [Bradyrhizobium ivorense]